MSVQIRLGLQKYYFIMETRNIAITIKKAKEWYYSSNQSLKEVALQAFSIVTGIDKGLIVSDQIIITDVIARI